VTDYAVKYYRGTVLNDSHVATLYSYIYIFFLLATNIKIIIAQQLQIKNYGYIR